MLNLSLKHKSSMIHPETAAASDSLWQRLRRVAPWFAGHPGTLVLAIVGILIGSATEPAIPALMKPLLDKGFQQGELVLWKIPVVLLLLFGVRGLAGFVASYCLGSCRITSSWTTPGVTKIGHLIACLATCCTSTGT
jgi:hypothetical protein